MPNQRVVVSLGRRDRYQALELQRPQQFLGEDFRKEGPRRRSLKSLCENCTKSQLLRITCAKRDSGKPSKESWRAGERFQRQHSVGKDRGWYLDPVIRVSI